MKKGTIVKINSTGEKGKVMYTNRDTVHVRLDTGKIEKFSRDAVSIVLAIETVFRAVKSLFSLVKNIFK